MRRTLVQLHRYTGLVVGLCLALTGVSGGLLVFDHALDEAFTPALQVAGTSSRASLKAVVSAAASAAPRDSQVIRLDIARQSGSPHTVRFRGEGPEQSLIEVSVDPGTASVLSVREWGHYPMSWLYRLHYTLLAGETGKTVVGVLGIFLLFFCFSGLYLWWPRRGRWRQALSIESRRGTLRLFRDIHRVVGIVALPVLCLCAVTGIAMVFAKPVATVVGSVLETRALPSYRVSPEATVLPLDEMVQRALQHWPGSELRRIYLPQQSGDSVRINLHHPEEAWSNHGASSLWLNPYNGAVLGEWAAPKLPLGNRVLIWVFPLHNADALGLWARYLWVLVSLTPAILFISGVVSWWQKRQR